MSFRAKEYARLRDQYVQRDPKIMGGEPVIRGTRVPVRTIAALIEDGESHDVLREDYPHVPEEAYEVAVLWARENPRVAGLLDRDAPDIRGCARRTVDYLPAKSSTDRADRGAARQGSAAQLARGPVRITRTRQQSCSCRNQGETRVSSARSSGLRYHSRYHGLTRMSCPTLRTPKAPLSRGFR